MTILPYKNKFLRFIPCLLAAIFALGLIEAKKSSKGQPPKNSGSTSNSGSGGGGAPSLTAGNLTCTNGRNRCLHAWETMFYSVTPYQGTGRCAPKPFHPKADKFSPVCQFDMGQTAMLLACGSDKQPEGKDTVEIVYDGETATATTSGKARAIFATSKPKGKFSLKSGTITATDSNMDLWVYCFDEWSLYLVPANGTGNYGTPSCPDGQSKCLYSWKGDYERIRPNEGKGVCSDAQTSNNEFLVTCSFTKQQATHYPIACAEPAVSTIDLTYDANGNGQAVSTGQAKALFAQSLPYDVNALLSGTVTSSVANENVYFFCPE